MQMLRLAAFMLLNYSRKPSSFLCHDIVSVCIITFHQMVEITVILSIGQNRCIIDVSVSAFMLEFFFFKVHVTCFYHGFI